MRSASNSIIVLQILARDALEIAGVVARGERVLLAADGGDHLRESPGRILRRALEHQMLEEMRDARLARRLVGGADLVPHHVGHDRRAVIGDDDDFEPFVEREMRRRPAPPAGWRRANNAAATASAARNGAANASVNFLHVVLGNANARRQLESRAPARLHMLSSRVNRSVISVPAGRSTGLNGFRRFLLAGRGHMDGSATACCNRSAARSGWCAAARP